jgi:hypothetical protein
MTLVVTCGRVVTQPLKLVRPISTAAIHADDFLHADLRHAVRAIAPARNIGIASPAISSVTGRRRRTSVVAALPCGPSSSTCYGRAIVLEMPKVFLRFAENKLAGNHSGRKLRVFQLVRSAGGGRSVIDHEQPVTDLVRAVAGAEQAAFDSLASRSEAARLAGDSAQPAVGCIQRPHSAGGRSLCRRVAGY